MSGCTWHEVCISVQLSVHDFNNTMCIQTEHLLEVTRVIHYWTFDTLVCRSLAIGKMLNILFKQSRNASITSSFCRVVFLYTSTLCFDVYQVRCYWQCIAAIYARHFLVPKTVKRISRVEQKALCEAWFLLYQYLKSKSHNLASLQSSDLILIF